MAMGSNVARFVPTAFEVGRKSVGVSLHDVRGRAGRHAQRCQVVVEHSIPEEIAWTLRTTLAKAEADTGDSSGQRLLQSWPPPRVIWIQRGNCSTDEIIAILRTRRDAIHVFAQDPDGAFLVLS